MSSRKSFNLSLQKKRNLNVLTPILDRCDQDGSYVADRVIDYVEKALNYEQSIGLNKVQNMYGLIKNTLASQYQPNSPEFDEKVEAVLQSIVSVDGERLAQFLSDPTHYSNDVEQMPASTKRSIPRQSAPSPAPSRAVATERSMSSTAVAEREAESVLTEEEVNFQREVEEHRRRKEEQRQREQEEENLRLQEEQENKDNDEGDDEGDDDGIDINLDALNNF